MLDTYKIVIAAFLMSDKANRVKFFEETFLVANVSLELVFEISFLTLSDIDVDFLDQGLWWRTYTIKKSLTTIRYVELVEKKKFAAAVLDLKHKTFIVYIVSLSAIFLNFTPLNAVQLFCRP